MELLQIWTKQSSFFQFESFKYKTSITGNTYNVGVGEDGYEANKVGKNKTENVISLKHLSTFWGALNTPLINYQIELILNWSKKLCFGWYSRSKQSTNWIRIWIKITKLYVPVVTLSKENDVKLLEQLKTGFKITIKWNKYRSQMTIQPQNNNLNYLIDPTFINVNRIFVLSFARNAEGDNRDSFSHYYVPNVEIMISMS